jgi:uncharacterized membrane protein YoaK (UPF0700 family)
MEHAVTPRRRTILWFTWAAGCVDAIVYIVAHVFTANMTGNAVLLGISLGRELSMATVHSLVALVTFTAGVIMGSILVGEKVHGIPWKGVRIATLIETMVLALFAAVFFLPLPHSSEISLELLISLSGFAMGMQSATVKRLNLPGIATTYITGTMTSLISGLIHHWGSEESEGDETEDPPGLHPSIALQAWVFMLYALAAVSSAVLYKYWPSGVALLPLVAMIAVTISVYTQHPPKAKPHQ